jgi:SAM-dependent methyltransferase
VAKLQNLSPEEFAPILADLGIDPAGLQLVDPAPPPPSEKKPLPSLLPGSVLVGQIGGGLDIPAAARAYKLRCDPTLPADGWGLFFLKDQRESQELVRWRNAFWPWLHLVALYRIRGGRFERETLQGQSALAGSSPKEGVLLALRRREHVLSPAATVAKFDQNAPGWSGDPRKPGWKHHRWMRRFVADFAGSDFPTRVAGRALSILDFGCGGGWVGIEAALRLADARLAAFDPSPEMVRLAGENARASGVARFEGRVGFGEDPPFGKEPTDRFDLVLSSGVVSFAPHTERWFDGLARTVKPGGTLVVGDIQRDARGMQRRRASKIFLPAREMNALTHGEAEQALGSRGFRVVARAGYQLTHPVPGAMHWSDTKLGGALTPLCLMANRMLAGKLAFERYDSWVLRAVAGG